MVWEFGCITIAKELSILGIKLVCFIFGFWVLDFGFWICVFVFVLIFVYSDLFFVFLFFVFLFYYYLFVSFLFFFVDPNIVYGPIQLTVPCGSVELIANIIGLGPSGNFTIRAPLNTLSAESWSNADEDLFLEVQTMLLVSVNNYLETVHLYSTLKTMTLSCFPEVFAFFLFVFFLFCFVFLFLLFS